MRTPLIVVETARRVAGEPWAQMRRSVAVFFSNCVSTYCAWKSEIGGGGRERKSTYGHHFASLPNHAQLGTDVDDGAV